MNGTDMESKEKGVRRIEIEFPVEVILSRETDFMLQILIDLIIKENPVKNHKMWLGFVGAKILSMGIEYGDDHMDLDEDIYNLIVNIKEKKDGTK